MKLDQNKLGHNKLLITFSIFTVILALGFIGSGITGMVVSKEDSNKICFSDDDCNAPKVCCFFYEENAGICNNLNQCSTISRITMEKNEEKWNFLKTYQSITESKENIIKNNYYLQIVGGILILIIVAAAAIYLNRKGGIVV